MRLRSERRPTALVLICAAAAIALPPALAPASVVVLRDGRILHGELGKVAGLAENVLAAEDPNEPVVRPVLLIDDGLRRTFVPTASVAKLQEMDAGEVPEKIRIHQRVAQGGNRLGSLGPILSMTPFDDFGRRTFSMMTDKGPVHVIQGITEITPLWTKVEGLLCERPFVWDMRLATSSIPRETLNAILARQLDPKQLEHRLKLVRLFLQSERYKDAQLELESIVRDFPTEERLKVEVRALRQLHSRKVIDEVNLRRKAGQHRLAYSLLKQFPSEDVAGETLQQVREILAEYTAGEKKRIDVLARIHKNIEQLGDPATKARCEAIYSEMSEELGPNTIDRLADYLRLVDDPQIADDAKLAMAMSGWLLGANEAITNLSIVLSAAESRQIVRRYLTESVKINRAGLLKEIERQEASDLSLIARLVANMKPPYESPGIEDKPGLYELSIPGLDKDPDVSYYVQLPPEYDAHRRYPTIVTLNGSGSTPLAQIDWWAGAWNGGSRLGQATRFGYIVVAVDWAKHGQMQYGFSAREHAAVLGCLRDACRRFSIDTDRVFLSGHSIGGDAAWDIALAHPDLWAGVIPIVAVSQKFCSRYWENAGLVPFYVVAGELDGDKTARNARDLDRYLLHRYDVTVVEYLGRGHEHFSDEIQRAFDWMGRRQRNFFPKKFAAVAMRTWDTSFWWLELAGLPPAGIIEPADWPPRRGFQPLRIKEAKIMSNKTNNITVTTGADKLVVWLSPELVDFEKPIIVRLNGRRLPIKAELKRPSVEVLLEDVRTRGERQHPFWARLDW